MRAHQSFCPQGLTLTHDSRLHELLLLSLSLLIMLIDINASNDISIIIAVSTMITIVITVGEREIQDSQQQ